RAPTARPPDRAPPAKRPDGDRLPPLAETARRSNRSLLSLKLGRSTDSVNATKREQPGGRMLATTKNRTSAMGSLVRFGLLALLPDVALGFVLAREVKVDIQKRDPHASRSSSTVI